MGKRCPDLTISYVDGRTRETKQRWSPNHGRWYARYEAPKSANGKRRQPWLGPFDTEKEAKEGLVEILGNARAHGHVDDRKTTVSEHLDRMLVWWKTERKRSTHSRAVAAVELYWRPGTGHIRLADLREDDVRDVHAAMRRINRDEEKPSEMLRRLIAARATWNGKRHSNQPLTEATIKRTYAVLVTALNAKAAKKALPVNPASEISFRTGKVKPVLWTDERVERFLASGKKPSPVMVWTHKHAGAFLDCVAEERLYPLWHLAVYWGLRRGELVGLEWADVRLDARRVTIRQADPDGELDSTKSEAGERTITIDHERAKVLKAWRQAQRRAQAAWGSGWVDSGRVFTYEDGSALKPGYVSDNFERLFTAAKLPPVRFHDLRHGSATMLLAAGVDMKVVSEILGHASSAFTADVYTSAAEELAEQAAAVVAAFIPRKANAFGGDARSSNVPAQPTSVAGLGKGFG